LRRGRQEVAIYDRLLRDSQRRLPLFKERRTSTWVSASRPRYQRRPSKGSNIFACWARSLPTSTSLRQSGTTPNILYICALYKKNIECSQRLSRPRGTALRLTLGRSSGCGHPARGAGGAGAEMQFEFPIALPCPV